MKFIKTVFLILLIFSFKSSLSQDSILLPSNQSISIFLNDFNSKKVDLSKTPGWSTAVYMENSIDMTKSYGYTSTEKVDLVNGNSVFRLASVSKIFTAIAVMQQVEKGKLSLSENIQSYLSVDLGLKYPITLKHLLTHTAGFEDKFYGDSSRNEEGLQDLGEHLKNFLPTQVYEPGKIIAYSNYGNALAAFVVESVTNVSFWKYVEDSILKPLHMEDSGYLLNSKLKNNLVSGYDMKKNKLVKQPYSWVHRYPASSIMSTSNDMLKLIKALLNDGTEKKGAILSKESINTMFSPHFYQNKELPPMSLTWMPLVGKNIENGYWHDGSMLGYFSTLVILPEKKAGFFITCNSRYRDITGILKHEYVDFLFNSPNDSNETKTLSIPFEDFSGSYVRSRKNYTTFEKMSSLTKDPLILSKSSEGIVWKDNVYKPFAANKFISNKGYKLIFEKNEYNTLLHVSIGGVPITYIKQHFFETSSFQFSTIIGLLSLMLILLIVNVYQYFKKKKFLWIILHQFTLIVFFSFTFYLLSNISSTNIRFGEIMSLKILLIFPLLSIVFLFLSLRKFNKNIVYLMSLTVSILTLVWAYYWNVLGWNF